MDKVKFDKFLETHGVKEDFYEDADRMYEKSSVNKDDQIVSALENRLSPFIWCLPDWSICNIDWNYYDDLFDLEMRGA